jgi:hypothetical protein
LQLLALLEQQAAEVPLATDLVSGWFDDVSSAKLISAGMVTLGDLGARVAAGGGWYRSMPGVGKAKAQRMIYLCILATELLEVDTLRDLPS